MSSPSRLARPRAEGAVDERLRQAMRDGPSERELDAALAQLCDVPLPPGFVARTVERATGWPRFRVRARDLWLPVSVGLVVAAAVAATRHAVTGFGPLWLRRFAVWVLTAWSDYSPLPPPPAPVLLLVCCAAAMLLTTAIVLAVSPTGAGRSG